MVFPLETCCVGNAGPPSCSISFAIKSAGLAGGGWDALVGLRGGRINQGLNVSSPCRTIRSVLADISRPSLKAARARHCPMQLPCPRGCSFVAHSPTSHPWAFAGDSLRAASARAAETAASSSATDRRTFAPFMAGLRTRTYVPRKRDKQKGLGYRCPDISRTGLPLRP